MSRSINPFGLDVDEATQDRAAKLFDRVQGDELDLALMVYACGMGGLVKLLDEKGIVTKAEFATAMLDEIEIELEEQGAPSRARN